MNKFKYLIVLLIANTVSLFSQEVGEGFIVGGESVAPDGVPEPGVNPMSGGLGDPTPIDQYLPVLFVLALTVGIVWILRKKRLSTES